MEQISDEVLFYPASEQVRKVDLQTGSKYWAVRSKNLMFTYFDVPPYSRFEQHQHESEQITYVIEGKLYFEIDNKIYKVCAGDVISIASFKPHQVWTESEGARAVDAWSPVNDIY